ncbi:MULTISPECIES: CBS domain-containing protein [unclassified Methylophaga]|jgi:predicted transcriptional regulator|uniref:CBS domain-containing protein n=1 Tax=unclassified Methylophaga TaxID=2629249 RepID=UPI000C11D575|nr:MULTISPECIES: CBS domain-containing protein [unclassified Methylophaga]MBL1457259.1 CBS domain-containing protein [Methylophaga sp.]|tara:strand:- start:3599 stop:3988 length:390 start_codon:yes stop_codon:yes gene_type:complete
MRLVKDVMITDVVTISPFAKMREALSLMKRHKIKSLVVDKQNQHDAFGLITYSDILKTVIAEEGDIDLLNVYDICAKPVIAVGEELAIQHVAKLMTTHRVKRLLVVHNNDLVGMVAMNDIMEQLLSEIE